MSSMSKWDDMVKEAGRVLGISPAERAPDNIKDTPYPTAASGLRRMTGMDKPGLIGGRKKTIDDTLEKAGAQ